MARELFFSALQLEVGELLLPEKIEQILLKQRLRVIVDSHGNGEAAFDVDLTFPGFKLPIPPCERNLLIWANFLRDPVVEVNGVDPNGSGRLVDQFEFRWRIRCHLEAELEFLSPKGVGLIFGSQFRASWVPDWEACGTFWQRELELLVDADHVGSWRLVLVFIRHLRFELPIRKFGLVLSAQTDYLGWSEGNARFPGLASSRGNKNRKIK